MVKMMVMAVVAEVLVKVVVVVAIMVMVVVVAVIDVGDLVEAVVEEFVAIMVAAAMVVRFADGQRKSHSGINHYIHQK